MVRTDALYSTVIRHSSRKLGDPVWAHEEAQQLLQGLAEVVVSALLRIDPVE